LRAGVVIAAISSALQQSPRIRIALIIMKKNGNINNKEQHHSKLMHLEVLDGVRSLTTIGILFIHVQFFFGWIFYHSAIPCYAAIGRS
jgi:hypothetical protein